MVNQGQQEKQSYQVLVAKSVSFPGSRKGVKGPACPLLCMFSFWEFWNYIAIILLLSTLPVQSLNMTKVSCSIWYQDWCSTCYVYDCCLNGGWTQKVWSIMNGPFLATVCLRLLALLSDGNTCLDSVLFCTLSGNYVAPYITALEQGDHCVVLLAPLQTFRKRHSIGFSPTRVWSSCLPESLLFSFY